MSRVAMKNTTPTEDLSAKKGSVSTKKKTQRKNNKKMSDSGCTSDESPKAAFNSKRRNSSHGNNGVANDIFVGNISVTATRKDIWQLLSR